MSCTNPIYALYLADENGVKKIKVLPKRVDIDYKALTHRYGKDNVLMLPCGHCESCIESRAQAWAARCILEASLYESNCFLTLTYDDQHLPKEGLRKKDLQDFIKRLRYKTGKKIRYYGCGEYGSNTFRPHYHIIIFNYFPSDAQFLKASPYGGNLYTSKELSVLWSFGISSIGEVSYKSAGYVARYCQKKLKHPDLKGEFSIMSLKPGIGQEWFNAHIDDIYDTDKVYFDFGQKKSVMPFRYFDKLLERIDSVRLAEVKNERITLANANVVNALVIHSFDCVEKLNRYNGEVKKAQFRALKRRLS